MWAKEIAKRRPAPQKLVQLWHSLIVKFGGGIGELSQTGVLFLSLPCPKGSDIKDLGEASDVRTLLLAREVPYPIVVAREYFGSAGEFGE